MVPARDSEARIICSATILKSSSLKTWHWLSHIKACVALILDGVRRYRHCCTDANNCRDMEHHHSRCERLDLWVTIVNRVWFATYARCWGLWHLISLWIAIRSERFFSVFLFVLNFAINSRHTEKNSGTINKNISARCFIGTNFSRTG